MTPDDVEGETVVVLNPASGGADEDRIRDLAAERGYRVVETEGPGDGERLAREAAGGASTVVAAGGDGTVHEVVSGLVAADALDAVTFGVVPAGTGNNFAGNVGVTGVEQAFEVVEGGAVRQVDLGTFEADPADGPSAGVFVNSCIGGLTAEASGQTTSEMKQRYGVFAYVVETFRTMAAFEPLPLTVETRAADAGEDDVTGEDAATGDGSATGEDDTTGGVGADTPDDGMAADGNRRGDVAGDGSAAGDDAAAGDGSAAWSGEAAFVLVGNGRRFPVRGRTQGHMEDGLLEVTIVEEMPARELLGEAALQRLFGRDTASVTRLRSPAVDISVQGDEPVSFSLDGEMGEYAGLSLGVRERALRLHVGDGYRPNPDVDRRR